MFMNYPITLLHAKHPPLIKVPWKVQKLIAPEKDYEGIPQLINKLLDRRGEGGETNY